MVWEIIATSKGLFAKAKHIKPNTAIDAVSEVAACFFFVVVCHVDVKCIVLI